MAVIYYFPSSIYKSEYMPSNLDELEPLEPLGVNQQKAASSACTAEVRVGVNSMVLHDVVVTITLTRLQSGLPVALPPVVPPALPQPVPPNMVASNGAVFTYFNNDSTTPFFEAKWTRPQITYNTETTFTVGFNVGPAPGNYQITFRVMALELQTAMTRVETLIVV